MSDDAPAAQLDSARRGPMKVLWSPSSLASDAPVARSVFWFTWAAIVLTYALLWSSHWYPLSDSSLYLNLARGLASGKSIEWTRLVHKSIRPLTPLMLSWVMKAGGGIGAMHALLIGLTVLSHALAYQTLKRWFNQRIALAATLATAASWWVFANAFTIMTEPLFLAMFWGAMLAFAHMKGASAKKQAWLIALGIVLLAGAWGNRVAGILFVPGVIAALWFAYADVPRQRRLAWITAVVAVFGLLFLEYRRPVRPPEKREGVVVEKAGGGGGFIADVGDTDIERRHTESYKWKILTGPVMQLPVNGGRWSVEGLMPATIVFFGANRGPMMLVLGALVGLAAFAVMLWGLWIMFRRQMWWPAAMLLYFFPIWIMWGTRLKPRYMVPVTPILFICLWMSLSAMLRRIPGVWIGRLMLACVLLANVFPYCVELYIRRASHRDFYDIARQGAYGELVDIAAWLQHNAPADALVHTNQGAHRRVIEFLTGRQVVVTMKKKRDLGIKSPRDAAQFELFSNRVNGPYAIVHFSQNPWPMFHWPFVKDAILAQHPRFWQLYVRKTPQGPLEPVEVPKSREYVDHIPPRKTYASTRPATLPSSRPAATQASTRPGKR